MSKRKGVDKSESRSKKAKTSADDGDERGDALMETKSKSKSKATVAAKATAKAKAKGESADNGDESAVATFKEFLRLKTISAEGPKGISRAWPCMLR